MTCAHVVATPTMQRGPGPTESRPGATSRVLRTPCDHLVCEKTPVHRWHGVHTASYRKRSPWFCPSRKPLAEFSKSSGAEDRAGQSRYISRISQECIVGRLLDHHLWWIPASGMRDRPGMSFQWSNVGSRTPQSAAASW